ncbi:unnamed protein product [Heligmosomoides polygyrus]|uniref:Histone domain-containing protein n=1 Tax=Heligmosomoides polygyrus TaxID=6339 RepID=A0A183F4E0_HELPZ|nr:unnamed protein product [Heligmosomoides polygyrus]
MARTKERPPTAVKTQIVLRKKLEAKRQLEKKGEGESTLVIEPKKRCKNGVKALRDIRHLQRTTQMLIPRISFQRVVREIASQVCKKHGFKEEFRWQSNALLVLQWIFFELAVQLSDPLIFVSVFLFFRDTCGTYSTGEMDCRAQEELSSAPSYSQSHDEMDLEETRTDSGVSFTKEFEKCAQRITAQISTIAITCDTEPAKTMRTDDPRRDTVASAVNEQSALVKESSSESKRL